MTTPATITDAHGESRILHEEANAMDERAKNFDTINDSPGKHDGDTLIRYAAYAAEARSSANRLRNRATDLEGQH